MLLRLLVALLAVATLAQATSALAAARARHLPLPDLLPGAVGYGLFALFAVALHQVLLTSLILLACCGLLVVWLASPHEAVRGTPPAS